MAKTFIRGARGALGAALASALLVGACKDSTSPSQVAHGNGANCVVCHGADFQRWASTLHAASPAAVLTNVAHNSSEQLIDECLTCHAPFQAVKHGVGSFVQPVDTTGPWHIVADSASAWEAIKCQACHDPSSNAPQRLAYYDPATQAYVPVKDATDLCEKCHQAGTDDSRDLAGSVHAGLQCTDCHFQTGSAHSLDPRGACVRCHPAVNPNHPDVTTLQTTYFTASSVNNIHFIKCGSCHWWAQP